MRYAGEASHAVDHRAVLALRSRTRWYRDEGSERKHNESDGETWPRVGQAQRRSNSGKAWPQELSRPPLRTELGAGPSKTGKTAFFRSFAPHGEWLSAYIELTHRVLTHRHVRQAGSARPSPGLHLSIPAELRTRLPTQRVRRSATIVGRVLDADSSNRTFIDGDDSRAATPLVYFHRVCA